ncbi:MAG: hypothetical protein K6E14_10500 [Paludibacteraceae bacterium]|nr:hypothetical protein [Paludibacteraceae bacterium]
MQTINLIDNIVLKNGVLNTYGRDGEITRVFLRQGDLEGRCAMYSLMMLLMFHGIINRADLLRKVSANAPEYIKKLKKQFVHSTTRGYTLMELRLKLLISFNNKLPVDVFVLGNRDKDNLRKLHDMIKKQLDTGYPLQIGLWYPQSKVGHSVVVIGYFLFGTTLRLFCLDSAFALSYVSIWNNIIDVNVGYDDVDKLDFNHQANKKVLVDSILLIDDWEWHLQNLPSVPERNDSILPSVREDKDTVLPFEPEDKDSILPF